MISIRWHEPGSFRVFEAALPLARILQALEREERRWVVLKRQRSSRASPAYYAVDPDELRDWARRFPDQVDQPVEQCLELQDAGESLTVSAPSRPTEWDETARPPARGKPWTRRFVALDAAGRPVAVGEVGPSPPKPAMQAAIPPGLGPKRGAEPPRRTRSAFPGTTDAAPTTVAPPVDAKRAEEVDTVLSAQAPAEIAVGTEALIDVRLEVAAEAAPLAHALRASVRTSEKITVILSVRNDVLEAAGGRILRLDPPAAGRPTIDAFVVRATRPGPAEIALLFKQGGSHLGTLTFSSRVVEGRPVRDDRLEGSANAAPALTGDNDVLVLLVDERREAGSIRYRYRVYSRPLELNFREFESAPFLPRAGSEAEAPLAYVRGIYRRVVERVLANHDDLQMFGRELKGIGADLCRQLFKDDFVRLLWEKRDAIRTVQVTSWEPYIPWELLRLRHPDSGEADERFLCEYGLVRSLSGRMPPARLRAQEWRLLAAEYPQGSQAAVGQEVSRLQRKLEGLRLASGTIPASDVALLDALARPEFDVLHIACHGASDVSDIERTELILSDRQTPQGVRPVTVDATTVRSEARLQARSPLIFLNACETGRQAPSLTDWGGWPRTFCEAGAGAFVGTSWSVREAPAIAFSERFYDSLLGGSALVEAAGAGRAAAKALGDASWLAYVVYGHPLARVVPASA